MLRILLLTLVTALTGGTTYAFDVNDCIINGMKGVSGDAAARMVKNACYQKKEELKSQTDAALLKNFGEMVNSDILEKTNFISPEGSGFYSMRFTNKSADQSITFVRLSVTAVSGSVGTSCNSYKSQVFNYKVTIKPGSSLNLIFPSSASTNCVEPFAIRARSPRWSDVTLSSSVKPSDDNPFSER